MTACTIKGCDEKAIKCDMCSLHFEIRLQKKQSEFKRVLKIKRNKS